MALVPYVSAAMLCNTLSEPTYMAIFDQSSTGDRATVDQSDAVTLLLSRAHAMTVSWLPSIYKTMPAEPPKAVSALLVSAELDIAVCLSYRRHPEYVRTYGAEPSGNLIKEWTELMKRIQSAEQEIPPGDNPPEAQPDNVGGFTYDTGARIICDRSDGSSNAGDF